MGCGLRDLERFWSGTGEIPKFRTGPTRRGPRAALNDASWISLLTAGTECGNYAKRRSRRLFTGLLCSAVTGLPCSTAFNGTMVPAQPTDAASWCLLRPTRELPNEQSERAEPDQKARPAAEPDPSPEARPAAGPRAAEAWPALAQSLVPVA